MPLAFKASSVVRQVWQGREAQTEKKRRAAAPALGSRRAILVLIVFRLSYIYRTSSGSKGRRKLESIYFLHHWPVASFGFSLTGAARQGRTESYSWGPGQWLREWSFSISSSSALGGLSESECLGEWPGNFHVEQGISYTED